MDHAHHAYETFSGQAYASAVGPASQQNPAAHGGSVTIARCTCGAERRTNVNGRHEERGTWITRAQRDAGPGWR